jgi:hypothetical protein
VATLRNLTVGEAAKAMVLNGLGCINQVLNGGALGRALDTLYDYGVTELYSLITPTAAKCLGPVVVY